MYCILFQVSVLYGFGIVKCMQAAGMICKQRSITLNKGSTAIYKKMLKRSLHTLYHTLQAKVTLEVALTITLTVTLNSWGCDP